MSRHIEGFETPLHRALTDVILLGGAPRTLTLLNGTLAAAVGLGLRMWLTGLLLWIIGHTLSVFAAKRDPQFGDVLLRHVRQKGTFGC
jgi:type IV secretion system protein VirB3